MKPWDLDTGAAQLRKAMEDLQAAWNVTIDQWNDTVSENFRETHLQPIGPALKQSLEAIGNMQVMVNQMQRDLDDQEKAQVTDF